MLDFSEQEYLFLHATGSLEEDPRPDQDEGARVAVTLNVQSKLDRLNRWVDTVDH